MFQPIFHLRLLKIYGRKGQEGFRCCSRSDCLNQRASTTQSASHSSPPSKIFVLILLTNHSICYSRSDLDFVPSPTLNNSSCNPDVKLLMRNHFSMWNSLHAQLSSPIRNLPSATNLYLARLSLFPLSDATIFYLISC